jgi:cation diffusion facilitator family transporter
MKPSPASPRLSHAKSSDVNNSSNDNISMSPTHRHTEQTSTFTYGSVNNNQKKVDVINPTTTTITKLHSSFTSLKDVASRVAFLDSTKTHHHPDYSTIDNSSYDSTAGTSLLHRPHVDSGDDSFNINEEEARAKKLFFSHSNLRKMALDLSLYINIFILLTKTVAYLETLSLSILAALVDSILDVVSQIILAYTERRSSKTRSSAFYPAGAARLEPLGVLSCAALMGFASFGVLKEALEKLYEGGGMALDEDDHPWSSFWSMFIVVFVKFALWALCKKVGHVKEEETSANDSNNGAPKYYVDSTLEALALDHWNDCLSNAVACIALLCTLSNQHLWILDPIGAIVISLYIIFSWYSTGKEQIEQLTGKAAPAEFIDELYETANNFDPKMEVDVVRAYHFGPKFLVELEVVLPRDTLLFESHDLGMELQYEIESREEVERCFVHIDYESRPYDEHVVSKVPELRERYRPYKQMTSAVSI